MPEAKLATEADEVLLAVRFRMLVPPVVRVLLIVRAPASVPPATVTGCWIAPVPASVPPVLTVTAPIVVIGLLRLPLIASVPPLTVTVPARSVSPQRVRLPVPVLIREPASYPILLLSWLSSWMVP